jgi:hypothetical protein
VVVRRAHAILVAIAISTAGPASAGTPQEEHVAAVAAFQAGRALVDKGDCNSAVPKFQESLRHEQGIGALLSLAECFSDTVPARAWLYFRKAELVAAVKRDDRGDYARKQSRALEARLQPLRVTATDPGVTLSVDDDVIEPELLSEPLMLSPGLHRLVISAPGKKTKTILAAPGGGATVVIPPLEGQTPTAPVEPPHASPPAAESTPIARPAGIALMTGGAVGLIVGSIFGGLALGKKGDVTSGCASYGVGCDPRNAPTLESANNDAHTFATISTIAFVAGAALAAGGALLYFTAPSGPGSAGIAVARRW